MFEDWANIRSYMWEAFLVEDFSLDHISSYLSF
jgi:hypothetical protein